MLEFLNDPTAWVALLTLTALEIVLGIDNIVFISILSDKLPVAQRPKARRVGLFLAMFIRIALVSSVAWIVGLEEVKLFTFLNHEISPHSLILIGGGLFLMAKSVHEIHGALEGAEGSRSAKVSATFASVIVQILLLDIVFSIDSVITAVGLTQIVPVMIAAVVISVGIMMFAAGPIGNFVSRHPTVKMLALSFLILIGVLLLAEGFGQHVNHAYVYFAMAFSVAVEMLNLRIRAKSTKPVQLHHAVASEATTDPAAKAAATEGAGPNA